MNLATAIYTRYNADSVQKNLYKLYDTRAPLKAAFPYATFRLVSCVADNTMGSEGENILIQFNLFSEQKSAAQVEAMLEALKGQPAHATKGFDFCTLTVVDYTCLCVIRESITKLQVEKIWQYTVVYRIMLQYTGTGAGNR